VSQSTAIAFNDAINRRDLESLAGLMTDDHAFIDSDDTVLAGKEQVLGAWEGFFAAFPDYRNDWVEVTAIGGLVIALGRSVCSTEPALDGPAIWAARVADAKVSEWRIYEDTPANRRGLGVAERSC
jgi:ketosteroid isomerase-like protein